MKTEYIDPYQLRVISHNRDELGRFFRAPATIPYFKATESNFTLSELVELGQMAAQFLKVASNESQPTQKENP